MTGFLHDMRPCDECAHGRHNDCTTVGTCIPCAKASICPCWEQSHRDADFDAHTAQALAVVAES